MQSAASRFKTLPLPTHFHEIPGQGVEGEIDRTMYAVGSHAFIEEKIGKGCLNHHQNIAETYFEKNKILIHVAKNRTCIGMIIFSDRIRTEVPALGGARLSCVLLEVRGGFDGGAITSDAGGLLLREVEKRTGIIAAVCGLFPGPPAGGAHRAPGGGVGGAAGVRAGAGV